MVAEVQSPDSDNGTKNVPAAAAYLVSATATPTAAARMRVGNSSFG